MKVAVLGIPTYVLSVRVEGEVDLKNGAFVPNIVDIAVLD